MEENKQKNLHIMPNIARKGIGKYFSGDNQKLGINMKILIIIGVFSLILIFIGTIILLNSYNPHATSVKSAEIKGITGKNIEAIIVPSNPTNGNMLSLQDKLSSLSDSLNNDESNFESNLGY